MPREGHGSPAAAAANPPIRIAHSSGIGAQQLRQALEAHIEALATGRGVLKDDTRTAVTRVPCGDGLVCVKEYRRAGLLDAVKEALRGSRGRRAWRGAAVLARKGIATPEPLALFRCAGAWYLVTRYVEGAASLKELSAQRFSRPPSPGELRAKRSLIRQLARWTRRAHDLGVYHDDWSAKNFLAAETRDGWRFWLLDFESISARKPLTSRRRAKNLAQLSDVPAGLTATDKMRFLLAYAAGDRRLTRGRFPRAVARMARRRAEARQRRTRARR